MQEAILEGKKIITYQTQKSLLSGIPQPDIRAMSHLKTKLLICVSGFRMLEAFNLTEKTYGYVKGVSMEPGSFNSYTAYRLHKNAFLTQPTT